MKTILFILFLAISLTGKSQSETTLSPLTYAPSIPADSTYTIIKNTTGEAIPESIILEINLHRMNENYLWRVNSDIEILIEGIQN